MEGQARITAADLALVELDEDAITTDHIESGDLFRFQGDHPGYYYVASVTGPQTFRLTAPYSGSRSPGVFYDYLITRDFTPNHELAELFAGDVDIRETFTYNMRKIDEIMFIPSEFPAGVKMIFATEQPPLGWTRVTDFNDRVVRIVSGSLVNVGTTWQISGLAVPPHQHEVGVWASPGGSGTIYAGAPFGYGSTSFTGAGADANALNTVIATLTSAAGSAGVTSDGSWRPPSFDVILACKD